MHVEAAFAALEVDDMQAAGFAFGVASQALELARGACFGAPVVMRP